MPGIVEPLRPARILASPRKFESLKGFSSGRQGGPWEKAVNKWAHDLYSGMEKDAQTVVVVEDAVGGLVGVGSFRPGMVPVPTGRLVRNSWCVHMLGTDRRYRGALLADGTRPGDALMWGTLEHIRQACDGQVPAIWALVSPGNARSLALFGRHGFAELPYTGGGDDLICFRAPNKPLSGSPTQARRRRPLLRWVAPRARGARGPQQQGERPVA